jgi:aprataxin
VGHWEKAGFFLLRGFRMITGKKRKFVPVGSEGDSASRSTVVQGQDAVTLISKLQKDENQQKNQSVTSSSSAAAFGFKHRASFKLNVLYDYLRNPSKYETSIVYNDENCIIIKDVYPKSSFHFLLLAKETFLSRRSVAELVPTDLDKLKTLHDTAKAFTQQLLKILSGVEEEVRKVEIRPLFQNELREKKETKNSIGEFKFGYHIVPSLYPLHLHIITDDYNSTCLKTKSHWNSFVTDYFVPIERIEQCLSSGKEFREFIDEAHSEELLKIPLKCHKCSTRFANFPLLKTHLLTHFR